MGKVEVHEFKSHIDQLMDDASQGEDIIVVKNGSPFVRVVSAGGSQKEDEGGESAKPDAGKKTFKESIEAIRAILKDDNPSFSVDEILALIKEGRR